MSASTEAKSAGLRSLAQVSKLTGISAETLNNWYLNRPKLFTVVIAGCLYLTKGQK